MLRLSPLSRAVALATGALAVPLTALPTAACAADRPAPAEPVRLEEISVTSTRTQRRVDDVPGTVTVLPGERLEREGARDVKDAFRAEIDVVVPAQASRFTAAGASTGRAGNEGINIRGLEGNQVLILVDGIRVPNAFSFGAFSSGRGDFLAVDALRSLEVLRGPASTQFGSDGLAGVVSLRTVDPVDLLRDGRRTGGFARTSYASVDSGWTQTVGAAGVGGPWQGLLLASGRRFSESGNQGTVDAPNASRTMPNPARGFSTYLLGKAILAIDASHSLGFTVETQRRRLDTEVLSARAVPPLAPTSTVDLDARDRLARDRISVEHRYTDPDARFVQRAETRLYWQSAEIRQFAAEDRFTAADRLRDNQYRERVVGLSSLFEHATRRWLPQRLTFGVEASRTAIDGVRTGTVPPFGETFPTKPFPDTTYTLLGAFAQSEIEVGTLSVIPGVRFDRYVLSPSQAGYTAGTVVELSDQAVTPRLGVVWRLSPAFAPYAQWSTGFRAPTPDQVNNGFTNLASGYRSIGNPNLQAERARSVEVGARGRIDALRWSAAAFDNRYEDFISQRIVGGAGTPANPSIFQFVNLSSARIRGVELRTDWQPDARWLVNAAIGYTRGDTEVAGQVAPLDTIQPWRAVLRVRHDLGAWSLRATLLHSAGKDPGRVAAANVFVPPAFTVLDLGASWRVTRDLTLIANLNNVLDARYWQWSDVRGLPAATPVRDAFTAPGRNLQVSLRHDF